MMAKDNIVIGYVVPNKYGKYHQMYYLVGIWFHDGKFTGINNILTSNYKVLDILHRKLADNYNELRQPLSLSTKFCFQSIAFHHLQLQHSPDFDSFWIRNRCLQCFAKCF